MASLGKAVIEFSADTARFVGDIGRTAGTFEKQMGRMEAGVANIRNAIVGLAGVGGIGALITKTLNAGEELNKLSQKVGVSVEQLSELKFAAELADVGMDDLTRGFKEFNKTLTEATDPNSKAAGIFAGLGVSPSGDPAADLRKVSDAFAQLQDGATKSTIASELFGKSGLSWIPLLNQGGAALDKAADSARKLGLVIGPELARQSEQFNDNMKVLAKQSEALGISLTQHVVGGLTTLTSRLVEGAEKGNVFTALLRESIFLITALGEKIKLIPQPLGAAIFGALDSQKRGVDFNEMMKQHNARWGLGGAGGGGPTPGAPNPDALACVATGGKWVNGKCVRPGGSKKNDDNLVARQWAEADEEWAQIMSEAAAASDKFNQTMREREKLDNIGMTQEQLDQWIKIIDFQQELDIQTGQLQAGFDGLGNSLRKVTESGKAFGVTMASAVSESIRNWQGFDNLLKQIAVDWAQILVQKNIAAPLQALGSSIFGGMMGGAGGGIDLALAGGGSFSAGDRMLVGERGPEIVEFNRGGNVIPNDELGGGGITVVQNLHFSGRTDPEVRSAVMSMMPEIQRQTVAAVRADRNRTGDQR